MSPDSKKKIFATLSSLIGMAVFIILFIVGLVFFSYLLIIGAIIGLILFGVAYLRAKFFRSKMQKRSPFQGSKIHHGRTIDHDQN